MLYSGCVSVFMALMMLFPKVMHYSAVRPAEDVLSVSARSAILMCADSGDVLFEKSADEPLAIASITKIMTAVIALEYAAVNDRTIRFTDEMSAEGSSLSLCQGDVLTITELVKGMMCVSGNDAANALAVGIAGSQEKFAELMNKKAAMIGMKNTLFVTPSGLDAEGHRSTARDMALLCCYAMENRKFSDIVSSKSCTVSFVSPEGKTINCRNHNRMLWEYDGCVGIKTGFTKAAGRTLTSCAERNGIRLIAVTLNAPDDWNDHAKMLDYGFSRLERRVLAMTSEKYTLPAADKNVGSIEVSPVSDCRVTLPKDEDGPIQKIIIMPRFVYMPVEKGSTVGELRFFMRGKELASVRLSIR